MSDEKKRPYDIIVLDDIENEPPTPEQRQQLSDAILEWSKWMPRKSSAFIGLDTNSKPLKDIS